MTDATTRTGRSTREVNAALDRGRQIVTELRTRVASGKIERKFFEQSLESFANLLDDLADERQKLIRYERIARLYNVSRLIGTSLDLQTCLDQVMDAIIELSGAERGFLMMIDDKRVLSIKVA